ncbi:MAG: metalloregulator ArsR/SmtB family transcription factor [Proteobacteria bacterium]|nr:metalloregulator ArsR/SmtB family transcription factor [Pseudomonadota bacterium]
MILNQLFKTLSDESRIRLILLLNQQELTVAELSDVTLLAQPRVSTHLSNLRKNKIVTARKQGVSSYYKLNKDLFAEANQGFLTMIEQHYHSNAVVEQDNKRLQQVLSDHASSNKWVDSVAGDMERHYSPGRTWEATTRVISRLINLGKVLDIGSGDGVLAEILADNCKSYSCVDNNAKAIEAAKTRLKNRKNISFYTSDMHELPFPDESFDSIMMLHVLTYSKKPEKAIEQAYRVCKPGGKVLISTLFKHRHKTIVENFGHINLGFETDHLYKLCGQAGFSQTTATITSLERKQPNFQIITVEAIK